MRRTKIIATIGPASESPEMLASLVEAGMDVARLNASHSSVAELDARLAAVRIASAAAGRHVAAMLDIQGPKIRLGEVAPGTSVEAGAAFALVLGETAGDATAASVPFQGLANAVSPGDTIVIGDGDVELRVESAEDGRVDTRVVVGGPIMSRKGVTVRGVSLDVPPLTPADEAYVRWGASSGVDLIAQSFVRKAADVEALRSLLSEDRIPIVAKIERHEALEDIDDIVNRADGVMVARGDLGIGTAPEQVPIHQKRIVRAARAAGRPVIVATEMLESMLERPRPTRAEASDVANAVFDAVDAVMLSGETAVGTYPRESVATMARIASMAEESGFRDMPGGSSGPGSARDVPDAVSAAVAELARQLDLAAVVTATESGATARAVAARRPEVPIIAVTPDARVARQLALVWGVSPVVGRVTQTIDEIVEVAMEAALASGCHRGDLIAITAGVAVNRPGTTDLVQVKRL